MSKLLNQDAGRGAKRNTSNPREAPRIFLLSPANVSGIRAGFVMHESRNSEMAIRLREDGVSLGELFSFMSGLYFRGKLAYARAFSVAPPGLSGAFVITASGVSGVARHGGYIG